MARFDDMSKSDLTILTWQWLDEAYAELVSAESDEERTLLKGRCQAHSTALQFLLGWTADAVKEQTRDRYERAS